jgi:cell wall assembly regulator SMI1
MSNRKTRLTVDLSPEMNTRLGQLTEVLSCDTKASVVRKSIKLLELIVEHYKVGNKVYVDKDGVRQELLLLL